MNRYLISRILPSGVIQDIIGDHEAPSSWQALAKSLGISYEKFSHDWKDCEREDAEYIVQFCFNDIVVNYFYFRRKGHVLLKQLREAETVIKSIDKEVDRFEEWKSLFNSLCSQNNGEWICEDVKKLINTYFETD